MADILTNNLIKNLYICLYYEYLMAISVKFNTFAPKFNNLDFMAQLNRLKVVLVEQQKTGKWLAEQIGKSYCTVSKWCNNKTQPDLPTIDRISVLLNIDRKDLIVSSK